MAPYREPPRAPAARYHLATDLLFEETELTCPRCTQAMTKVRKPKGKLELIACGGCGGVWISHAMARLALGAEQGTAKAIAAVASAFARRVSERAPPVHCPECAHQLERLEASGGGEIDACEAHGTWFDRDELHSSVAPKPMAHPWGAPEFSEMNALFDRIAAAILD